MDTIAFQSDIEAPAAAVMDYCTRGASLFRLIPPWESIRLEQAPAVLTPGSRAELTIRVGGRRRPWVVEFREVDRTVIEEHQVVGPLTSWTHHRTVKPVGPDRCRLSDRIEYTLPSGTLGQLASQWLPNRLRRALRYQHDVVAGDVTQQAADALAPRRTVAITGATGLVGRALTAYLESAGHRVRPIVRTNPGDDAIGWRPDAGIIDREAMEGLDAVVHLAGENIAGGRWTRRRMQRIRDSRVVGTNLLARTIAGLERPPACLISASAIGIYGNAGNTILDESAPPGTGFLATLGRDWEAATGPARDAGVRVALMRTGIVLTPGGGALAKMLPLFRAGLGGPLGNGRQWMSWVSLDDAVRALGWAIGDEAMAGPVNLASPNPVTNAEFTRTLAATLNRPAIIPAPAWGLRAAVGRMADEALLASARVEPARLRTRGFPFRHPTLAVALGHVLGRATGTP